MRHAVRVVRIARGRRSGWERASPEPVLVQQAAPIWRPVPMQERTVATAEWMQEWPLRARTPMEHSV
jgi:hypothetical protein